MPSSSTSSNLSVDERAGIVRRLTPLLPGIALTFAIAAAATIIQRSAGIPALSPLLISIVIGIAVRNFVGTPAAAQPGVTFSLKRILRFAIVLLGFQLTVMQIMEVGLRGFAIILVTLVATFLFTKAIGRALGIDRKLAELIAAGTSVCGASAVIATNTVTKGSDEDVAYAIACVTLFGSLSMVLFPIAASTMALDPASYGLWAGASIHEVAQVVAAAFQGGDAAGQFGTVAKLSRVLLLAPLILALGFLASRGASAAGGRTSDAAAPVPWFVFGFLAVVVFNSLVAIPEGLHTALVFATSFLLSAALAAMGLETNISKLKEKGLRPLALGAIAWIFISFLGLGLVLAW